MSDHTGDQSSVSRIRRSSSGFTPVLHRKCACGGSSGLTDECEECQTKRLLGKPLQTKLRINEPSDEYEQEADRVADQVMRMPDATVNTKTSLSREIPVVQRRVSGNTAAVIGTPPSIVQDVLSSPGQPLDAASRAFFEPRFGHNFGHVRVHADAKAANSAQAVGALAYTVGRDVVFGRGQYTPAIRTWRQLLAHELTHVVQQQSIAGMTPSPTGANQPQEPPAREDEETSRRVIAREPIKLCTQSTARIQRSLVDVAFSDGGGASTQPATENSPPDSGLQIHLENVYSALAEIMTYYETKEPGWVEGVERMAEDALNNLSNLYSALGLKAIKTNRPETYTLRSRYDFDYFDLKSIFEHMTYSVSPKLEAEIIPTTAIGQAIGILKKLRPWWDELGLNPDSPIIEAIAFTLPEPPTIEVHYNNYPVLFLEGLEQGLGTDISEAGIALAKRHLRSSVALAVFQPFYLAGMVKGIYDKGAEIFAELEKFLQDPQAFVDEAIMSIRAMLSLPPEQIAFTLGESTGQSIRETIDRLKDQNNAYTYIFELGKVMGPVVAGVIIEIIFSKGVGWLAGKAIAGLKDLIRKVPSVDSLSIKYRGRRIPSEKGLEIAETKIEEAPSTGSARSSPTKGVRPSIKGLSKPFTILGEPHYLTIVERNGKLVLQLCSNGCGELIDKIYRAMSSQELGTPVDEDLRKLLEDAKRHQARWESLEPSEELTEEETEIADRALKELILRFEGLAANDPASARAVAGAGERVIGPRLGIAHRLFGDAESAIEALFPEKKVAEIIEAEFMGWASEEAIVREFRALGEDPSQWKSMHYTALFQDGSQEIVSVFENSTGTAFRGPHL